MITQPSFDGAHHVRLFVGGKRSAFLDAVPLFETTTTTRCCRVLGDEHWMPFPRRLSSVVFRRSGCQSLADEIIGVREDRGKSFVFEIRFILGAKSEALPKL